MTTPKKSGKGTSTAGVSEGTLSLTQRIMERARLKLKVRTGLKAKDGARQKEIPSQQETSPEVAEHAESNPEHPEHKTLSHHEKANHAKEKEARLLRQQLRLEAMGVKTAEEAILSQTGLSKDQKMKQAKLEGLSSAAVKEASAAKPVSTAQKMKQARLKLKLLAPKRNAREAETNEQIFAEHSDGHKALTAHEKKEHEKDGEGRLRKESASVDAINLHMKEERLKREHGEKEGEDVSQGRGRASESRRASAKKIEVNSRRVSQADLPTRRESQAQAALAVELVREQKQRESLTQSEIPPGGHTEKLIRQQKRASRRQSESSSRQSQVLAGENNANDDTDQPSRKKEEEQEKQSEQGRQSVTRQSQVLAGGHTEKLIQEHKRNSRSSQSESHRQSQRQSVARDSQVRDSQVIEGGNVEKLMGDLEKRRSTKRQSQIRVSDRAEESRSEVKEVDASNATANSANTANRGKESSVRRKRKAESKRGKRAGEKKKGSRFCFC